MLPQAGSGSTSTTLAPSTRRTAWRFSSTTGRSGSATCRRHRRSARAISTEPAAVISLRRCRVAARCASAIRGSSFAEHELLRSGFKFGTIAALIAVMVVSPAAAETTAENLANQSGAPDFFRPTPNMVQVTVGNQTAPGSNDTHTTTDTVNLRYDHAFDLPVG